MSESSTLPPPTVQPPPPTASPQSPQGPSPAVRLAWLIPGTILAVAALCWGTYNVLSLLAHSEYTTVETFPVAEVDSIDIGNEEGSITVTASETDAVLVTAHVDDGWQATDVSSVIDDGELVIRGGCPVFGSPWCKVDFTVEVPADMPMTINGSNGAVRVRGVTAAIDVDTDNGSIELEDISGDIRATNDNGRITGRRLTSQVVDTATENGRIELSFVDPPQSVSGRTSNGRIEVVVPDVDVLYRVDLRTNNGSTDNLVRTDPSSDHVIDLSSDNGSIVVRPPG
jgi:Putative adhesin